MALSRWAWSLGLALLAVGLYLPSLDFGWLNYDDDVYVTASPPIRLGLSAEGLRWALSSFQGANWFPLTRISWMLDYELFGLSARAFHRSSFLLHAVATVLLFHGLCRLTGAVGRSAFVAALFASHPFHVESVAWIAARKDPLSAVFFFLAIAVYARDAREPPGRGTRGAVLACLALGLAAKPIVVSLPAVLLLLDLWPRGRLAAPGATAPIDPERLRRVLLEKLPLFALALVGVAVAFAAQRAGGAVAPLESLPIGARLGNAAVAYLGYLWKSLVPTGFAVYYPHPGAALPLWRSLGAGLLLALLTGLALSALRRRPWLTVGWLWFLVTLLPAIGLLQVGSQAMANRYMYLPLVGLGLIAAWEVPEGLARLRVPARWVGPLSALAGALAIAALSLATARELEHWRSSEALFTRTLEVARESSVAHAHLGSALLERGDARGAIAHLRRALVLEPGFVRALNNLAWLLATLPDPELRDGEAALDLARRAVRATERSDPAVLDTLAAAHASLGHFARATELAERAARLADSQGRTGLAQGVRARRDLYREERPYLEPLSAPPPPAERRATR